MSNYNPPIIINIKLHFQEVINSNLQEPYQTQKKCGYTMLRVTHEKKVNIKLGIRDVWVVTEWIEALFHIQSNIMSL